LCLVIFRRAPVGTLLYTNVTSDAGRLNDTVRGWSDRQTVDYDHYKSQGQWAQAQQLMMATSPRVIGMHRDDSHQMNIGLANVNRCEYFKGRLRNGQSTLNLASARVLGNWLTSNLWSTRRDPWLSWPF
jgi:hypothetical protein